MIKDTMDRLKNTTGSSAEAEQTRRRLAEKLADEILNEAALPFSEPETMPIRSALALLFGDSQPDWDFAPKWIREDAESLLREVSMILHESTTVEDIVRDLENFSRPIGTEVITNENDEWPWESTGETAW